MSPAFGRPAPPPPELTFHPEALLFRPADPADVDDWGDDAHRDGGRTLRLRASLRVSNPASPYRRTGGMTGAAVLLKVRTNAPRGRCSVHPSRLRLEAGQSESVTVDVTVNWGGWNRGEGAPLTVILPLITLVPLFQAPLPLCPTSRGASRPSGRPTPPRRSSTGVRLRRTRARVLTGTRCGRRWTRPKYKRGRSSAGPLQTPSRMETASRWRTSRT